MLCEVLLEGHRHEHHCFNRFADGDVDLTVEQFDGHEQIVELAVLTNDEIIARALSMRSEPATRTDSMYSAVAARLARST